MYSRTPTANTSFSDMRARRFVALAIDSGLFLILFAGLFLPFRLAEQQAGAPALAERYAGENEPDAAREIERMTRPYAVAFLALLLALLPEAVLGQSLGKKAAGLQLVPRGEEHPFIRSLPLRFGVKIACVGAPVLGLLSLNNWAFFFGCGLFLLYISNAAFYYAAKRPALLDQWLDVELARS